METLGLDKDFVGGQKVGKGYVIRENVSPAALTYQKDGDEVVRAATQKAAAAIGLPWHESNALVLSRGPFVVAAGLDESVPDAKTQTVNGRFVDLFDPDLPVVTQIELTPSKRAYLFNLSAVSDKPQIVAAACRVQDEIATKNSLSFKASGVAKTNAVVRVIVPNLPKSVTVGGQALPANQMDMQGGILRLRFPNVIDATPVVVKW